MPSTSATRLMVVLSVALVATACGSSSTSEGADPIGGTTTIDGSSAKYWVARDLPATYQPVLLTDDEARRTIYYAPADSGPDVYDAPLRLTITRDDENGATARPAAEPVDVHGHDAVVVPLTDEGQDAGVAVTWEQAPDVWITVTALNDPSAVLSRDDVVAVAQDLQPVDATEWDRLRRALSIDTRVGRVDPDATEVEAISDTIDGETYTLTVLVPPGYPLGAEDQRLDCYRLTYQGDSSPALCDTHPTWLRVGGHIFVFGPAADDTSEVQIGPYQGGAGDTFVIPTSTIAQGPPTAFYATPLADGRCFVDLSRPDGARDVNLGSIGPLPANPEHAACIAQLGGG